MGPWRGLIDANVLVASAVQAHLHHEHSASLIGGAPARSFAAPRHCFAEFYSISTRVAVAGVEPLSPAAALRAMENLLSMIDAIDIGRGEQLDAIRRFSAHGGIGARVYDYLIGHVAVVNAIPLVVTWNVRHFEPLFPSLRIATPATLLEES